MSFLADRPWLRRVFLALLLLVLIPTLLLSGMLAWYLRGAIANRYGAFPKQVAAWAELRTQWERVDLDDGWREFRGVCHSHSEFSHDSAMPFPDILAAAKVADLDFLFMSDHCVGGKADYSLQWKGLHDGVLFVRGFELSNGLLLWGLPDDTALTCSHPLERLAYEARRLDGLVFFAHSEKQHPWDLPELNGKEIYNIHTDILDKGFMSVLPDMLLNEGKYPDQTMRVLFDRQVEILARWDDLNRTRKVVGIAAVDAHQNIGIHLAYSWNETLVLNENSGKPIREWGLNGFTRFLLRLAFGKLEPNSELFRITKDPYERSLRFVNTHLLARDLSESSLVDALREGRAYIAFNMLADSRGFVYFAEGANGGKAVMGEVMALGESPVLRAGAPYPGRFTVLRDGNPVHQVEGRTLAYPVEVPGKYRVEVELSILDEWVPWIYTNPLEIAR